MHDITDMESRGVVSVGLVTEVFRDGAEAQLGTLAFDAAVVYIPHPIQDRTNAELRQLADGALQQIIEHVTQSGGSPPAV
jgi:hypothetical protein